MGSQSSQFEELPSEELLPLFDIVVEGPLRGAWLRHAVRDCIEPAARAAFVAEVAATDLGLLYGAHREAVLELAAWRLTANSEASALVHGLLHDKGRRFRPTELDTLWLLYGLSGRTEPKFAERVRAVAEDPRQCPLVRAAAQWSYGSVMGP